MSKIQLSRASFNLRFSPVILIVIAAVLWSLDGILRINLRSIPPATLVLLEHSLGLIPLIPFLPTFFRKFRDASPKARTALTTTAVISGALGTIFYTAALAQVFYVPFSVVVMMQQLQPLFAVALASILLREKISASFIITAVFALIGAYLLSFPNLAPNFATADGRAQMIAALLALAAAISWGTGTVFSKIALKEFDFRLATTGRFLITIVAAFIISIVLGQTYPLVDIEISQWLQLGLIVFTAGMVALLIYYKGLAGTQAKVATFAELTWPLSVFAIDLARGVIFSPTQVIGAILLLIMIVRVSTKYRTDRK